MTGTIEAPAPAPGPEPSSGGGLLARLRSPWGLGGAAVFVAVVLVGVGLLRPPSRIDVFLESAGALGADPFLSFDGIGDLRVGEDILLTLPGGITLRIGTEPGLYGGSGSDQLCDPELIGEFLAEDPDKAEAWAGALGITVADIPAYLDTLTPVVLLADTWVTNHGYRDGRATPFQSVMQAGTMVLVDETGVPRVRCKCGNPLAAPDVPDDLDRVDFLGEPWSSFDDEQIMIVEAGEPVDAFVLVRLEDGSLVARPVGTTGDQDIPIDDDGNWIPELDLDLPTDAAPDDGPFPLPPQNSAGIDVEYAFDGPCLRRGDDLVLEGSGRCTVEAATPAVSPWGALEREALVVIGLRQQAVRIAAFGDLVLGEDPVPIGGLADSLLPVSYSAEGSCEVTDDGALAGTEAGDCTVTAGQPGDDTWAPAEEVTFAVATVEGEPRAQDELTLVVPDQLRLSDPPTPVETTSSSTRPVELLMAGACTDEGTDLVPVAVGECMVVAVQIGDDEVRRSSASVTVEIGRGLQSIGLDQLPEFGAPGDPALPLPATTTAGFEITYTSEGPCLLSDEGLVLQAEGTCELTGSAPGDDDTEPVTETTEITVDDGVAERQSQSISFTQPGSLTFGGGGVRLRASSTSGLPVAFTVTGGSCRLSGSTLQPGNAGTCTVTASQRGNAEWEPAGSVARNVSVAKARPSLSISASGAMQTTGSQPVGASVSGGPGASLVVVGGPCSLSGGTLTASASGACTLRASTPGGANHQPVSVDFTVQVSLTPQSIPSISAPSTLVIGTTGAVAASASSGLPVALSAGPAGVCTLSGGSLAGVGAGSCTVTAAQGGNGIFAAAPSVSATVSVVKAPHTISVSAGATTIRIGERTTYSVSSSAGLTPTVTPSGAACRFDGTLVVGASAGTCTVSASHPGTAGIEAASGSVTITVLRQIDSVSLRVADFPANSAGKVSVGSQSGLPVQISTAGACVFSDNVLLPTALGQCTITAATAGDGFWEPASASATINVTPVTPTIDLSAPGFVIWGQVITYQVFTNASVLSVTTTGPCTVLSVGTAGRISTDGVGTCTITATVGGGVFANRSASQAVVIDVLR